MPGEQVKNWALYHRLRRRGYPKERAAKIANANWQSRRRGRRRKRRKRR